jgi:hypothetical protein
VKIGTPLLAAAVAVAFLPACSSKDGPVKADCGAVPASLVNETLGTTVREADVTDNKTVIVCRYEPTTGSGPGVLVRFQNPDDAASFKVAKEGYTKNGLETKDVPGFADEAFSNTIGTGAILTNTLVARKGSVQILLTSGATIDKEKALLQKVFDAIAT